MKNKRYILNQSEYKKKQRNEQRLLKLKGIIDEAHRITRQIKSNTTSKQNLKK